MKYGKSVLVILAVICILFSVSGVVASDLDNATQGITEEDGLEINSPASFKDLANEINSDKCEIALERDYKYDSSKDVDYKNGVSINSNWNDKREYLVIDGKGHTIDGNGESKIFNVHKSNTTMKNIVFKNIYSSSTDTNGAIHWSAGDGVLENCTFEDIYVKYGTAAVNAYGNNFLVKNCNFIKNIAKKNTILIIFGKDSKVTCCNFVNNSGQYGGAVEFAYSSDRSQLSNCIFINNSASWGNAVYWPGNEGVLTNCTFDNCGQSGDVIYWTGDEGVLTDCTFNGIDLKFISWTGEDGYVNNGKYDFKVNIYNKTSYDYEDYEHRTEMIMDISNQGSVEGIVSVYLNGTLCYTQKIGAFDSISVDLNSLDELFYGDYNVVVKISKNQKTEEIFEGLITCDYNFDVQVNNESIGYYDDYGDYDDEYWVGMVKISNKGSQKGYVSIYLNDTLCYNRKIGSYNSLHISPYSLDKIILGTSNIVIKFTRGNNSRVIYEGLINIDYFISFYDEVDEEDELRDCAVYYGKLKVVMHLPDGANGKLVVSYNGQSKEMNYDGEIATLIIPASEFTIGNHNISATLVGDDLYPQKTFFHTVKVFPEIYVPDVMSTDETDYIIVGVPKDYNGKVTVYNAEEVETEDDYYYMRTGIISTANIVDGKAVIPLTFFDVGTNSIIINCSGDGSYENYFDIKVINNNKDINAGLESNIIEIGDRAVLKITAPRSSNSVSIYVDGELYKETSLSKGEIAEYISNLGLGEHYIKICYEDYGEDEYGEWYTYVYSNSFLLTVKEKPKPTVLSANSLTLDYGASGLLTVHLNDDSQSPVSNANITVEINNVVNFLTTDQNGMANIAINGLSPGNYVALIKFEGNEKYLNSQLNVDVEIKKISSNLFVSNVNAVYNDGKYLVITLKEESGKIISGEKLSIVLNGKAYTKTTDEYGQAKVSTNGLAPVKTYKASITFIGNGKYDKSTTTAKVTVKKATPKLTAKAKTFKTSVKSKNYVVTLKTNLNKVMKNTKLTLKVNGKTYSAKTNVKGQATFKITKLTKKGIFKAVITFAGNKYYNKLTKNVQIVAK